MPGENTEPESTDEGEESGETQSAASRWWLTNDILAGVLIGTLALMVLASLTPWYTVPKVVRLAFVGYAGVAVVWLFGKGAAKVIFSK